MRSELSQIEIGRLSEIERRMEERAEDMAGDLRTIRDERLYRASHDTFEDYCRERWGMTRQHANRLIRADAISEILEPIGSKSESVAREVLKAPVALRADVVSKIVADAPKGEDGRPKATAADAKKAVKAVVTRAREKADKSAKAKADPAPADPPMDGGTAPGAAPPRDPDAPAWAEFVAMAEAVAGELKAIEGKLARLLDANTGENKCRAPWAYFVPCSGTVLAIRQARKTLLENLPAEADRKPPGYLSRKGVEMRDAVARQQQRRAS